MPEKEFVDKGIQRVFDKKNKALKLLSVVFLLDILVFIVKDIYFHNTTLLLLDSSFVVITALFVVNSHIKSRFNDFVFLVLIMLTSFTQYLYMMYLRIDIMALYFMIMIFFIVAFSDLKMKRYQIVTVIVFYAVLLSLYFFTGLNLFKAHVIPQDLYNITKNIFIAQLPFMTLFGTYAASLNSRLLFEYQGLIRESERIYSGQKDIIDVQTQSHLNLLSDTDMDQFYTEFLASYPLFCAKVMNIAPKLVAEEMKVVALVYFNYTTKEIAGKLDTSFRAVEAKKYRIRKKLDVPTEKDISVSLHGL